jgi:hypothetical protein
MRRCVFSGHGPGSLSVSLSALASALAFLCNFLQRAAGQLPMSPLPRPPPRHGRNCTGEMATHLFGSMAPCYCP